ncbi:MAG: NRDE family protein [Rhodothermales bacterium]|nr:NRDE family protein [Rhodothermales bacterium]MBO6781357.1 NRDE family protein [Rhodothermales bacterium]
MCLILFAINSHPEYPLVLAANRDEFLSRPTAPAGFWKDAPERLGGRDLTAGGTWLAVSKVGGLAAVTNVREPSRFREGARSRGDLVTGALEALPDTETYLQGLDGSEYNGYNLIVISGGEAWYTSNRVEGQQRLAGGVYGLSNARLDTPWPKVVRGKDRLAEALSGLAATRPDLEPLFRLLADTDGAPDAELPDTGVPLDVERRLASPFIRMDGYGTRSSTVVLWRSDGTCLFAERTFPPAGGSAEDRRFEVALPEPIPSLS